MKKSVFAILILLAFAFNVKAQDYSSYTKCAEQDSLALVAFYNATDGPNWICNQDGFSVANLSDNVLAYHTIDYPNSGMGKWLVGPVKNWYGVLLEKQQVGTTADSVWRVVHLLPTVSRRQAGDNKLKGYVPREIGFLTALKWFKVNGNAGLGGTELPKELYKPELTDIDVEAVYFEGEVSNEIRNCTNLWFANFRYNLFDTIPTFDFLTPDITLAHFSSTGGGQSFYFYNNRFTFANVEASVKYWLTFSTSKQVQYEARQLHDIGREREIIVKPGEKVVLTTNVGGENGGYTWYKKGINTYLTGPSYTINSVAAKDTGAYKVLVTNELVRLNDLNSDYVNTFSSNTYVRFTPSTPTIKKMQSTYNGSEIEIILAKPMAIPSASQATEFTVKSNGKAIPVSGIKRGGRFNERLILNLSSPLTIGEAVTVDYSGTVVCANGGTLQSFTGKTVQNLTRVEPKVSKIITREDGTGIFITFDQYIDPATLSASNFVVSSSTSTKVASVILKKGEIDQDITKTIELVLTEGLTSTDEIKISYTRGTLAALYGGLVASFSDAAVQNVIVENRTSVLVEVEDGTKELTNLVVKGNLRNLPFNLFDDGTNGDKVAGDHIWSRSIDLSDGSYTWEVYERKYTYEYDTVSTVNTDGTITQVITPKAINNDSFLSEGQNLNFNVATKNYSGTTFFGYKNNTLTIILQMAGYQGEEEIAPSLMGIDNDWTTGIEMTKLADNKWTTTIGGLSIGDVISFNFRNGDDWENYTPQMRSHTVTGNNTIYLNFGNLTDADKISIDQQVKVYPNPATDQINIFIPESVNASEVSIRDVLGRVVLSTKASKNPINVSSLNKGVYVVAVKNQHGNTIQSQFMKN
jgi:hypothetical protein